MNIQGGRLLKRILFIFTRGQLTRTACGMRFRLRWALQSVAAMLAVLILFSPIHLRAETLQLESNETLFYVMATINAAGYDEGLNLPDNNPLRKTVRDYLAGQKIPVLSELKTFYRRHMQKTGVQDLSQYISWAFAVTGAPDFAWKGRDVEVPLDAMALEGFQPLMIDFYRQANLPELWKRVQPAYEAEIARYHTPILNTTGAVDAYLRASSADFPNRRFHAIVELLAAPQMVQSFHYGDDSYIVITPAEKPLLYDIRHGYLFSLIDPIMLTYRVDLHQKESMLDLMGQAPLPEEYKTNFVLLCSQSLVKAVEARMDKDTNAIDRATRQGYIMTPFFAEQLPTFEHQQQSLRFYADEMINAIDLKAESQRLSTVKFDSSQLQRVAKQVAVAGPELSPSGKTLEKAENLYAEHATSPANLQEAKVLFAKALEQKGEPAEHAQAWYGLARIAIAEKRGQIAVQLLEKTLESSPDDFTRGWSNIYLARLHKSQEDFSLAMKYYQDALAVNGASEKAKDAARKELQELPKNQEKQTQ